MAEVDGVQRVAFFPRSHDKVTRLDVAMKEALGVDVFYLGDGLVGDEEHGLEGQASMAIVQQVFQRRAKKIADQDVKITLCSDP